MKSEVIQEETKHPFIIINPKIGGGSPTIKGTRTKVIDIAIRYELMGMSPDQIIEQFPHLTLAQIHDALSYYYEHKKNLDEDYQENQVLIEELKRLYPSGIAFRICKKN